MLFEGAPVASIHRDVIAHVERAGDNLAASLGEHETKVRGKAPMQLVEKLLRQILPAIVKSINVVFIKLKHRAQMFLRQLLPFVSADGDSPLSPFPDARA